MELATVQLSQATTPGFSLFCQADIHLVPLTYINVGIMISSQMAASRYPAATSLGKWSWTWTRDGPTATMMIPKTARTGNRIFGFIL